MKMREALWSAVACYRFRSGQLAGRGRVYRAFGERSRERARGIKAAASCRTPQRLRRLTPVFSIEASPIFMAARDLLFLCFQSNPGIAIKLKTVGSGVQTVPPDKRPLYR